jgi:hypothetical protein
MPRQALVDARKVGQADVPDNQQNEQIDTTGKGFSRKGKRQDQAYDDNPPQGDDKPISDKGGIRFAHMVNDNPLT